MEKEKYIEFGSEYGFIKFSMSEIIQKILPELKREWKKHDNFWTAEEFLEYLYKTYAKQKK